MKLITNYIFGPEELWRIIKYLIRSAHKMTRRDVRGIAVITAILCFMRWQWQFAAEALFFWSFAFWLFYWKKDARTSIVLALAGLIVIPVLLFLGREDYLFYGEEYAERVAVWVYFFLVIGVAKQIVEFRTGDKEQGVRFKIYDLGFKKWGTWIKDHQTGNKEQGARSKKQRGTRARTKSSTRKKSDNLPALRSPALRDEEG